jgi:WD40 repeat protein
MFRKIFFTFCYLFIVAHSVLSAQQPKLVLPIGHTNFVDNACFFPDGKKVLTASADKTAKIWDAQSGALLADLKGHAGNVTCARISSNGKKIVTASNDGTAKIWNAETGDLLFSVKGQGEIVYDACFSQDSKKLVITGADSIAAEIWDVETGRLIMDLKKENAFALNVCFSPDGGKILTSNSGMFADIWDAQSGELLGELEGNIHWVNSYCFSPDGKKILTASRDTTVKIWDAGKMTMLAELKGHDKEITRARFSPDGKNIITASDDSSARIWNTETGTLITTIRIPKEIISDAVFSPDNKKIATLSGGKPPRIWRADGSFLAELKGHTIGPYLRCINFSPDSKKVLTASADYTAKIWNAQTGVRLADLNGHTYEIYNASFSPDGKRIATATTGNTPIIWDAEKGVVMNLLKGHKTWVYDASFSPDGKKIITASADNTAKIWNAQSGALLINFQGHQSHVSDAVFSPDGKKAITVSWDSTVKIWDAQTGTILKTMSGFSGFGKANFSPDGKLIVTADYDSSCKIWNAESGLFLFELKKPKPSEYGAGFINASFSPDGKKVIAVSMDTTAEIWDLQSRKILFNLKGHSARLTTAFFSPDGKKILTASEDATANIWNAENAQLLVSLKGHDGEVRSARYSPDGRKIVTASWDNTVKIWDAATGSLIYTFFALDSSDYFIQIPKGYYFCTPDAAKLLHYTNRDLKMITFEQLDIRYNRPDLVLQGIGCPDTALIQSYRKVWQKRMKKLDFDTAQFREAGFHVPETSLPDRENISYVQTSNKIELKIKAKDDSLALDRFNVWINKVPLFGVKGISLKSRHTTHFDTTVAVTLSPGANRIETSVTNTGGLESYHEPLDVRYESSVPVKQRLHFIGIGTDHFAGNSHDLQWSVKDIRDLAAALQKKYGTNCSIDTLFDSEVTIGHVLRLKSKLLKTTENDKVIVAFSGHGLLSKEYDYFLSAYDVDFQEPEKNGLPYELLEQLLDSIPAREKLMLIDACHSGEVDKDEMQQYEEAKTRLDVAGIQKGVVLVNKDSSKLGMKSSVELMEELFVNVGKNTGATIISAAAGTQFALEKNNLKNGVFTYTLLEYMRQHDHATVNELKEYVNHRVPELTAGMQSPTTRTENIELNWEVW